MVRPPAGFPEVRERPATFPLAAAFSEIKLGTSDPKQLEGKGLGKGSAMQVTCRCIPM
jgi:hypothetical protein